MPRVYSKLYTKNVPQSEKLSEDQVLNNAGGYVFAIDQWSRLDRFLILGSDTNTYYQKAQSLTKENAKCVNDCWTSDPERTANTIVDISTSGRAPKNDPAIFALSLGSIHSDKKARQLAHAAVQKVCRTGTHLFTWMKFEEDLGKGSGRGFKRVLANWYIARPTDKLAVQAIKYKQRHGFTHKRAIELSNHGAGKDASSDRIALFKWMRGKENFITNDLPDVVLAHLEALKLENNKKDSKKLVGLIEEFSLPWEALPTWALKNPDVWEALVPHSGIIALVRNLGNMGACGYLGLQNWKGVVNRLENKTELKRSKIHPFNILNALAVYKYGQSYSAQLYGFHRAKAGKSEAKTWTVVPQILDVLDSSFYAAFQNVEPTNKNILVALDVSGSMSSSLLESPLTVREAAAAMALVTLNVEPNCTVIGYTCSASPRSKEWGFSSYGNDGVVPLTISARQRLDDVVKYITSLSFGGTDCSLPFLWATKNAMNFDAVVSYTDNETWHGNVHPQQALKDYRKYNGNNVKSIVCGMTSTGFSIADPNDAGSLDVVGMDSSVPSLISNFIRD